MTKVKRLILDLPDRSALPRSLIDIIIPRIENKTLSLVKDIALVLSFAIVTGVCAKLKIKIGVVPITIQTLIVLLKGVGIEI